MAAYLPIPTAQCVCSQQACEMVMDILRERDQGGFGDRNEYGSRVGGGIDVSASSPGRWAAGSRAELGAHQVTLCLPAPRFLSPGIQLVWSLAGVER